MKNWSCYFATIGTFVLCAMMPIKGEGIGEWNWFTEDVESFLVNEKDSWTYPVDMAKGEAEWIKLLYDSSISNSTMSFSPSVAQGNYAVVEMQVAFDAAQKESELIADQQGVLGVQLVQKDDGQVFALYNALAAEWQLTDIAAAVGVEYTIKVEMSLVPGARYVCYWYRVGEIGDFIKMAVMALPYDAEMPDEIAFSGEGRIKKLDGQYQVSSPGNYPLFDYANAIVTWESNENSFEFREFVEENGVWGDGDNVWVATNSYSEFPGYSGDEVQFWYAFQRGHAAYHSPGYVLRLAPGYDKKITTRNNNFSIAGLIVETGASGYEIASASSTQRNMGIGDPDGLNRCKVVLNEDIAITRGGEITLFGELEFSGFGKFKSNTSFRANENAKLDFSLYSSSGGAFENLKVDETTSYGFPVGLGENVGYNLCSGTLTAPLTQTVRPISIGAKKFVASLKYDTIAKTVAYSKTLPNPSMNVTVPAGYVLEVSSSIVFNGTFSLEGKLVVNPLESLSARNGERIAFITLPVGVKVDFNRVENARPEKWAVVIEGNVIYLVRRDYSQWSAEIVTWEGQSAVMQAEVFSRFDAETGGDTDDMLEYRQLPEDCVFRFASKHGYAGLISLPSDGFYSSGLIIEPGATNLSFSAVNSGVHLGGVTEICEPVKMSGEVLIGDVLRICGNGVMTVDRLNVADATVDFSAAVENPIKGTLVIDDKTIFAFADDTAGSTGFKLVNGSIVGATDGVRLIKVGDEYKFVNASFSSGKMTWTNASVNKATVNADASFFMLNWNGTGTWIPGAPAEVTLGKDVTLTINSTSTEIGSILYRGAHTVVTAYSVVPTSVPTIHTVEGAANVLGISGPTWLGSYTFDREWTVLGSVTLAGEVSFGTGASIKYQNATDVLSLTYAGVIDFNGMINEGKVKVGSGTTLKGVNAGNEGTIEVVNGGKLKLDVSADEVIQGYWATGVTLASGAGNVTFVFPDGSEHSEAPEVIGNLLTGAGVNRWIGTIGGGNGTDWNDANNWSSRSVPTAYDNVIIGKQMTTTAIGWNVALDPKFGTLTLVGDVKFTNSRTNDVGTLIFAKGSRLLLDGGMTFAVDEVRGEVISVGTLVKNNNSTGRLKARYADGVKRIVHNYNPTTFEFEIPGMEVETVEAASGVIGFAANAKITGTISGAGEIAVLNQVVLDIPGDTMCAGIKGRGTVSFRALPTAPTILASLKNGSEWYGTAMFVGIRLEDFNPDDFGRDESSVKVIGCYGYFKKGSITSNTNFEFGSSDDEPIAFDYNSGYNGAVITFRRASGNGCFRISVPDEWSGPRVRAFITSAADFVGSIKVEENGNRGAIIVGAEPREVQELNHEYDGSIVSKGVQTIAADAEWGAVNGIVLDEDDKLINYGKITGPVVGSGTVVYSGMVGENKPEAAARYSDDRWSGMVRFENAVFDGAHLNRAGNDRSTVEIYDATGYLANEVVLPTIRLSHDGFNADVAKSEYITTFRKITGNGAFTLSCTQESGWGYRLIDTDEYLGPLTIEKKSKGSVLIGEGSEWTTDGSIQVADDAVIKADRNWEAPRVLFGNSLRVVGKLGDSVMRYVGDDSIDFGYVVVAIEGEDSRVRRTLELNGDTHEIVIVSAATIPSAEIDDYSIVYGVDFTNVTIKVNITNFWEGTEYEGGVTAEVYVRDSNGAIAGYVSRKITEDGEIELGNVYLPDGKGNDFDFEVVVNARKKKGGVGEEIAGVDVSSSGVRRESGWFDEDAETFAGIKSATGVWTLPEQEAEPVYTQDGLICFNMSGDDKEVTFKPTVVSTEDSVKVVSRAIFDAAGSWIITKDMQHDYAAAITLVELDDGDASGGLSYAVWIPEKGAFEPVSGTIAPALNIEREISWTINYKEGTLTYAIDGCSLTNAEGRGIFALPQNGGRYEVYGATGMGKARRIFGDQYNSNLAAYVDENGVTNEFSTVDQAVSAALARGMTNVVLLWDSSWRPASADVGKMIRFDQNGHDFVVDVSTTNRLEREGYVVIDNGDGSYLIDVIKFSLAFNANGGSGAPMENQWYSATNMIFRLMANTYTKAGEDFKAWNDDPNGSGTTNWEDCAEIDMTPYGLTNMTLYAQWQTAVKRIIIEPADEFVYIESVKTNGVENLAVRYYRDNEAKATGSAIVPVEHGSDVEIMFSTDIEKQLSFYYREYGNVISNVTLRNDGALPTNIVCSAIILTPMQEWAMSKGISLEDLAASEYSESSYALNVDALLTERSEVIITDFKITDTECSFSVMIDGEPLSNLADISGMVRVSNNLFSANWPEAEDVTVDENGVVTVRLLSPSMFVKLVIPKNN